MPAHRLSMRKITEVLRLKHEAKLSNRQIAASTGIARSTVADYLRRAEAAAVVWPLPEGLTHERIEALLFSAPAPASEARAEPDWAEVHHELRRKGVTLRLLWEEYKQQHPDGYQYSRYCERYGLWRRVIEPVMRQHHAPGDKLFVDYAGQTVPVTDPETGEVREAQIFVAVLGASNYSFAEATWTQGLEDWVMSHRRAFEFIGGVPRAAVPDNLKSGVTHPHRYDPEINRTYADLAAHYRVAVLPARSRKPRDKAKVETGVQVVERWILARLRNRRFFSLGELNQAIAELLDALNTRPFQKLPGSRLTAFEEMDRPALRPLPAEPYVYALWKKARVNLDYHVEIEGHYYSVPYRYLRQQLDVRLSEATVECFHQGQRIAAHRRSMRKGRHTTMSAHMPASHRAYAEWTPERIAYWAAQVGPATEELAQRIMAARTHPEQGFRTCLGIMRLGQRFGNDRLEAAARRALVIGALRVQSVASILERGLDSEPLPEGNLSEDDAPIRHTNIRGPLYFN